MQILSATTLAMILCMFSTWRQPTATAEEPEDASSLVELAKHLTVFPTSDVVYGRIGRLDNGISSPGFKESYKRLSSVLTGKKFDTNDLVGLLKHENAKVRTLALAALFHLQDPQLLPHMVGLLEDTAQTFPDPAIFGSYPRFAHGPLRERRETRPQTVGDVCKKMVNFYMHRAGTSVSRVPESANDYHDKQWFTKYWEVRKNRQQCASWLLVRWDRASGGASPTPAHRLTRLKKVRQQIDAIPGMDSPLILLWIAARGTSTAETVSHADLIRACGKLGRQRLVQVLQGKPPTDDPDLKPWEGRSNFGYQKTCEFILQNATDVLAPTDASTLLTLEAKEHHEIGDSVSNLPWAIAAARLQPERSQQILHKALDRGFEFGRVLTNKYADMAVALWNLRGEDEERYVTDWFYSDQPRADGNRVYFLQQLAKTKDRAIYASIVQDKRFERLDCRSVLELAAIANRWCSKTIIPPADLQDASHPFGLDEYEARKKEAREKYPKQSAALETTMKKWRARLRDSTQLWTRN